MIYKFGNKNLNGLRRSVRSKIMNKFKINIVSDIINDITYNAIGICDSDNNSIIVINDWHINDNMLQAARKNDLNSLLHHYKEVLSELIHNAQMEVQKCNNILDELEQ